MTADQKSNKTKKSIVVLKAVLILLLVVGSAGAIASYLFLQPPPLRPASKTFLVDPYLQFGNRSDLSSPEILWATLDEQADWTLEWKDANGQTHSVQPVSTEIDLQDMPKFKRFEAHLEKLPQNVAIPYTVLRNSQTVFSSEINPLRVTATKYRFDVTGDIASGTVGQRQVAVAMYNSKPDITFVAGDVVYPFGRALDYLDHFFPIYNSDTLTLNSAPMLRSSLWIAAPGNHDVASGGRIDVKNLDQFADGLAYFLFWRQPLNGPQFPETSKHNIPLAEGSEKRRAAFLKAAGPYYPRETNFSLDFGNSHWLILDGDPYMDWTDEQAQQWVDKDLSASHATWKFVLFHQGDFNSDLAHFNEQRMRVLSPIFQRNHVDIVFAGHMHSYQRTFPLTFEPQKQSDGRLIGKDGTVRGKFQIDKSYDGQKNTTPNGVIHIVTGCGGAHLSGAEMVGHPERWQPFTAKFESTYSFTRCDVDGSKLSISQVMPNGKEIDHFEITK